MAYKQNFYIIDSIQKLNTDTFLFNIKAPDIASIAMAGQFIHIKIDGFTLRRPISIFDIDRKNGVISIVFQSRGEGTTKLGLYKSGESLDIMGPLGHGFDLNQKGKVILIGGGIGVPPLQELSKHFGDRATAILGFRDDKSVILNEYFEENSNKVFITTDNGSDDFKSEKGIKKSGFVTDTLSEILSTDEVFDGIFACGPEIMLKKIAEYAIKNKIRCQISLEERMGCGVGACLVCACKTKDKKTGEENYSHVCKKGPVFEAEEVVFNE